jgi:hypothetical protein
LINEALTKHGRFNEDGLNVLASRTRESETGPVTVGAGQAVVEVDAVVTDTCSVDTRAYPTRSSFIVTTCRRTKAPPEPVHYSKEDRPTGARRGTPNRTTSVLAASWVLATPTC